MQEMESKEQYAEEVVLSKKFKFMYENFIFSSQRELFLLLEENNGIIDALRFDFKVFKYGYPNDEVGLPSQIEGVQWYAISQVFNSKWLEELRLNNSAHPRHSDSFYSVYKHYIVRFKDVTLEVIADDYNLVQLKKEDFLDLVKKQIEYISRENQC